MKSAPPMHKKRMRGFWRSDRSLNQRRVHIVSISTDHYDDKLHFAPKVTHWFALDESRPLFAFAGIWRLWTGERKGETGEHNLFAFLTTQSNDVVRPIHAKAMPVMLTTDDEWNMWLDGSVNDSIALQRPLPNELLRIVATGEKSDRVLVED
jgi:putative SOS response-associated peptidase YedK